MWLAALYAFVLGGTIVIGLTSETVEESHNAVAMPDLAFVVAGGLGIAGAGLLFAKNWARLFFFLLAPTGALAVASAMPEKLWADDLPYSILLAAAYFPTLVLLSRAPTLRRMGIERSSFVTRGGALLLVLTGAAVLSYFLLKSQKSGSMNEYVKKLAMCYVHLWHYFAGLVAVSIPSFRSRT